MIGHQFAPLEITTVDPGNTKDSEGFGICPSDGQTYVIKSSKKHPLLPATEAFCEALGGACQLPVTNGKWLSVNGDSCYGSRYEGGITKDLVIGPGHDQLTLRKTSWRNCTNPGIASAVFVFDLFIFNYDRHHSNWAFQDQNGNVTARIYDFSKAWWICATNPAKLPQPDRMKLLPSSSERTCSTFKEVCKWTGVDNLAAKNVLDLLRAIPASWVETQLTILPSGWIDLQTTDLTLKWWDSPLRTDRVDQIEQGLKNATLF